MKKSTLRLLLILNCISFLFAQIHLNRSNLESVCECRIQNRFIKLISKNISTIDPYTFQNLTQYIKIIFIIIKIFENILNTKLTLPFRNQGKSLNKLKLNLIVVVVFLFLYFVFLNI